MQDPDPETMRSSDLERVRDSAVRRCLASGASRHDAEDCAQEALLALLTEPPPARPRSAAAWVATVAYRRYVDLLRRRGREQAAAARIGDETDRTLPGLDELVTDRAMARWLVDGLAELPPTTHQVCVATGGGEDTETVARRLNLTRRSVESHLTRARRWLRTASVGAVVPPSLVLAIRRLMETGTPVALAAAAVSTVAALVVPLPRIGSDGTGGGADGAHRQAVRGATQVVAPPVAPGATPGPVPGRSAGPADPRPGGGPPPDASSRPRRSPRPGESTGPGGPELPGLPSPPLSTGAVDPSGLPVPSLPAPPQPTGPVVPDLPGPTVIRRGTAPISPPPGR